MRSWWTRPHVGARCARVEPGEELGAQRVELLRGSCWARRSRARCCSTIRFITCQTSRGGRRFLHGVAGRHVAGEDLEGQPDRRPARWSVSSSDERDVVARHRARGGRASVDDVDAAGAGIVGQAAGPHDRPVERAGRDARVGRRPSRAGRAASPRARPRGRARRSRRRSRSAPTPSASAASTHLTAAPRSTVRLRSGPEPGPAPAANTIASAPPTCGVDGRRARGRRRPATPPSASMSAGVVGVADQPAGGVAVGRQQADEATGDLSVAAGDQYVHARSEPTGRARAGSIASARACAQNVDNRVMVAGYVIMRVAMVFQWGRAARQDPERRPAAHDLHHDDPDRAGRLDRAAGRRDVGRRHVRVGAGADRGSSAPVRGSRRRARAARRGTRTTSSSATACS